MKDEQALTLVVRRTIRASAEFLFDAWTQPEHLKSWWGPKSVTCEHAEVDLRVGGGYRIGNRMADGRLIWIEGTFEAVDRPDCLVYSWGEGSSSETSERVTVKFEARGDSTEVVVTHERIPTVAALESHEWGWIGCLDGLIAFVASQSDNRSMS